MYNELKLSKNNLQIPLANGIFLHSKYDPLREAEQFASQTDDFSFAVVFGIAGGYHISSLLKKNPDSKILCVEDSDETIDFLCQIENVQNLKNNSSKIIFTSLSDFSKKLLENYIPQLYGNLTIIEHRAWSNIFQDERNEGKKILEDTLKLISQDFSVQSHFGKLWQKNIFENISLFQKYSSSAKSNSEHSEKSWELDKILEKIDLKKKAAVIAAGPTLDENIFKLKQNRNDYVVISTDTAFSTLLKNEIKADFIVSIDAQNISRRHYIENFAAEKNDAIFVFDLCANPSAVKKVLRENCPLLFVQTGHPLSKIISSGSSDIPEINSGSGTVAIACTSLAFSLGFSKKNIEFFGADFSYLNGKPYAKGTYLDSIAGINQNRLCTTETQFSKIMFRTPLKKLNCEKNAEKSIFTTEILESYKNSLFSFLEKNDSLSLNSLKTKENFPIIKGKMCQNFNAKMISDRLENLFSKGDNVFLLPLAAKTGSLEEAEKLTRKYINFL